jgi:hypothetical protein
MDPSFTRLIKLDILTALALEPAAIEAVLNEFRTYIRHGDKNFACGAIRAVGTVVELARIVHDRHGAKSGDKAKERRDANRVALNCLHGFVTLTKASEDPAVVGECVTVMQRILLLLSSGESVLCVEDPNHVQDLALRRIVLLLVNALSLRATKKKIEDEDGSDEEDTGGTHSDLKKAAVVDLPPEALATALWIVGEWNALIPSIKTSLKIRSVDDTAFSKMRLEISRLLLRSFVALEEPAEKEQAIHFASKVIVSSSEGNTVPPVKLPFAKQFSLWDDST